MSHFPSRGARCSRINRTSIRALRLRAEVVLGARNPYQHALWLCPKLTHLEAKCKTVWRSEPRDDLPLFRPPRLLLCFANEADLPKPHLATAVPDKSNLTNSRIYENKTHMLQETFQTLSGVVCSKTFLFFPPFTSSLKAPLAPLGGIITAMPTSQKASKHFPMMWHTVKKHAQLQSVPLFWITYAVFPHSVRHH